MTLQQIPGLDGDRRQEVCAGLWTAWRAERRGGAILTGFSGTGKTDRVVSPLVDLAQREGIPAVQIEAPLTPTDLDQELLALLTEGLQENGYAALADGLTAHTNFHAALAATLRGGALVVIDEFQRLLDTPTARPVDPFGAKLRKLAAPRPDSGCLWLVSNREVDPGWAQPFHLAYLQPPDEVEDALRILCEGFGAAVGEWLPTARRSEVVRRLGFNPRVLRLLGTLLRSYSLEELLGPPADLPEMPLDASLIDQAERTLLAKAREGLSGAAAAALRDLSVLREAATWPFVEAMIGHRGNSRELTRELRERYLLNVGPNRYRVHPVVREVEVPRLRLDVEAWRSAHRRAGEWYARPLLATAGASVADAGHTLALAGARYHLGEAQADDVLRNVLRAVQDFITRKYHWTAPSPASAADRDARIALLELFLEQPGTQGAEFQLAKALKQRGAPGDLEQALHHAERATAGQNFSIPWLLWTQLVREVQGLEAGVAAAKTAAEHVKPEKNLYTVYQFLGACLGDLGRIEEAVDALLDGTEKVEEGASRLIEEAVYIAAPAARGDTLRRVRDYAGAREGFEPQLTLCDVLLLEHQGRWRDAALAARQARDEHPKYLPLAGHEALAWLGGNDPASAQAALDRFPGRFHEPRRVGFIWLAALVALHNGQLHAASELLAEYLGTAAPNTADGIRAALLREWDHRVRTVGEPNPAFTHPILPPTVTGLEANVMRPQHGSPVLPQHQTQATPPAVPAEKRRRVLVVATEWRSGNGGLSTLNRQICCALAAAGAEVVCLVLDAPGVERQAARAEGVTLVEATRTAGATDLTARLSRRPILPSGFAPEFIIGHGRVTGPAAQALLDDFPMAKRLHFIHMAPDEIEWFKPGRDDDAGARAEERTAIELELGRTAIRVVAIGPRLHQRALNDFHPYKVPAPIRLDPGFDAENEDTREPPPGKPIKVLVLGRMEDWELKGLDLAARAAGLAASRRGRIADPIELVVRGAPEGTSEAVRKAVREWAGVPELSVVIRPYTADAETLGLDIHRASLVLMPSRSEGFGMVGLEAIVAGTPVLVSDQSGLGALLREVLEPEQAGRFVVRVSGDDRDREEWGRAVEAVLRDRDAAFRRAVELRTQLSRQKTWAAAIVGLWAELGEG